MNASKYLMGHDKYLFSSKKFGKMDNVALSFIFNKYYPIMD